jgi:hypothetical protein
MAEDMVQRFISEDDLKTFDGWLRYQGIDAATTPAELETWRGIFDEAAKTSHRPWQFTIGGEPQSSKLKQGLNLANFLG